MSDSIIERYNEQRKSKTNNIKNLNCQTNEVSLHMIIQLQQDLEKEKEKNLLAQKELQEARLMNEKLKETDKGKIYII